LTHLAEYGAAAAARQAVASAVIASHPVGAKRRRMTGSAKQSRDPSTPLDCYVALLVAMTVAEGLLAAEIGE
jgi:hypothetical protein